MSTVPFATTLAVEEYLVVFGIKLQKPTRLEFLVSWTKVMDSFKKKRMIRRWHFSSGSYLEIVIWRDSRTSADLLKEELTNELTQLGKFDYFRYPHPTPAILEQRKLRFGGDAGVKIFRLFSYAQNPLVLGLLKLSQDISPVELGLGSIFYLKDTLQVPSELVEKEIMNWISFLGDKMLTGTQDMGANVHQTALTEIQRNQPLHRFIESLINKGWKEALPAAQLRILKKYERPMRYIGRKLVQNQNNLTEGQTHSFVVFHSYVHIHLLCLNFPNMLELLIYELIQSTGRTK